jgi:hypothetical protein
MAINLVRKTTISTLLILFAVLGNGCNILSTANTTIPAKQLPYPNADYYSLVRVNGDLIAFAKNWNTPTPYQYANQGESALRQLQLPDEDPRCLSETDTDYDVYTTFPDGRLQLWEFCRGGTKAQPDKTATYLLAYEWQTSKIEEIAGPLPLGSSDSSWKPDMTQGIAYLDSKFASATLYWIWKGGFSPLDLVIGDGNHSWNLRDDFPDFNGADKGQTGNLGRAAWSPDGQLIAFFASPDAIGKTGSDRFSVEYNLYMMHSEGLNPRAVFNKVYFPFVIRWSPDSQFIAFIGEYGHSNRRGIWLYSLKNNSVVEVAKGKFQDILWGADGSSLIAIQCDENIYCSKIEDYDLTNIIE